MDSNTQPPFAVFGQTGPLLYQCKAQIEPGVFCTKEFARRRDIQRHEHVHGIVYEEHKCHCGVYLRDNINLLLHQALEHDQ